MADTTLQRLAKDQARALRRSIGEQLGDLRAARDLSIRELAAEARVDRDLLSRVEAGEAALTTDGLAAVAACLGAHASLRLYGSEGPRLRDHTQALMVDVLASALHARWRLRLEVPVWKPVRGVVDLVIEDERRTTVISGEAHGQLRRVEQQIRWASERTDALADGLGQSTRLCRLLLLRNSHDLRAVVTSMPDLLRAGYPGRTAQAVAALTGPSEAFPSAAICWVDLRGSDSRVLAGPPRGVVVGR